MSSDTGALGGAVITDLTGFSDKAAMESEAHWFAAYHPLAMLGHLNDVDKHRYMQASWAAATVPTVIAGRDRPQHVLLCSPVLFRGWGIGNNIPIFGMIPNPDIVGGSIERY